MTLADAIIDENIALVRDILSQGQNVNQLDEYGFTPLIEAAIADNLEIATLILQAGANVNLQDMTGSTALTWAAENNNVLLAEMLLQHKADPNAYTFAGQPVLTMPLLRQQPRIKKLLMDFGADLVFAQDYINTKLLGHLFELVGTANIIDPKNHYVEIDFEGFYLEVSLGIIMDSITQFKNHFAARQMRQYEGISQIIVSVIQRAAQLIKYQQYRVNISKHQADISALIQQEPVLIPVAYEGHAITLIKFGDILVKCDRRESSRHYDNVVLYHVGHPHRLTTEFMMDLIYEKHADDYINHSLPDILKLTPVTEIKVTAQISGNCSWANVEACIPALHFLLSSNQPEFQENMSQYKNQALKYFHQWREWNKDRALSLCIKSMMHSDSIRNACKAEILAAILFQCCNDPDAPSHDRALTILPILVRPEYEYILQNYIKTYCYEDAGEEGKNFLRLLRNYGYVLKR